MRRGVRGKEGIGEEEERLRGEATST